MAKYLTASVGGELIVHERFGIEAWLGRIAPGRDKEQEQLFLEVKSYAEYDAFSLNGTVNFDIKSMLANSF